ncbi:F-type H+-transporting ATPase subunit b [Rhodobacter aestuarii]|uniref:ATP synthase subunit b n=1 Tax=Rhodobacter aestuarii TaxID=453582 RepID=A0A1N7JND1_9RHOB|nr:MULTISPECIES: F0F1 ATP synthase subunit B [Rhodobacter]PTV96062.1 F-type H+-transporting ATPase subunit b [Rhodobacter aestuarii]SIS50754.1 F-type H+-transporting ATPase subunit b [Rhodobacter aestuarii]SOC09958.1 F-type H+-transporting ATPase subunit b [Rhodobacter sp. JA431]
MKKLMFLLVTLSASPAFASEGPFFSLRNAHFVILVAFLIFIGVLLKFKVPSMLMGMLDKRAEGIKAELEEARALREEAQTILASYERKAREVTSQAEEIVVAAKRDAQLAAEQAKEDLKVAIERRLKAAEDRITSAEAAAVKEVKDRAVQVAVAAAGEVLAKQMSAADKAGLIDSAIAEVETRLH